MPTSHKQIESKKDILEMLQLFREYKTNNRIISEYFGISLAQVHYQRRKYHAYTDIQIDNMIKQIEDETYNQPWRNYKKQETHDHLGKFTLFFKCSCSMIKSEKDLDEIMPILIKEWKRSKKNKGGVKVYTI